MVGDLFRERDFGFEVTSRDVSPVPGVMALGRLVFTVLSPLLSNHRLFEASIATVASARVRCCWWAGALVAGKLTLADPAMFMTRVSLMGNSLMVVSNFKALPSFVISCNQGTQL